jgi:hypothetical protein
MEAWQPDPACIAAGDEYLRLAFRCWAGALSNAQIAQHVRDVVGLDTPDEYSIEIGPETAAVVIARHLALCGMEAREIVLALADIGACCPGWPDDPDLLISIAHGVSGGLCG